MILFLYFHSSIHTISNPGGLYHRRAFGFASASGGVIFFGARYMNDHATCPKYRVRILCVIENLEVSLEGKVQLDN